MANIRSGFQLVETKNMVLLEDVRNLMNSLWELPADKKYVPCPNPSNLERKDLPTLHCQEYMVSPKLDGMRFFLLMGALEVNDVTYSVFVNRSYQVYVVNLKANHEELFDGTLLDGELTREPSGTYKYTVFDAVVVEGYNLKNYPFSQRKDAYQGAVKHLKPPPGLLFEPKLWYPMANAPEIWASVRVLCDGLILQPLNGKLKPGIQADVFKWKPVDCQTVDFYISVPTPGHTLLECGHGADIICASEINCYFDDLAPCPMELTGRRQVYECCYTRFEGKRLFFAVIKLRGDKQYANDARVVISTLQSLQDNITVEELAKANYE